MLPLIIVGLAMILGGCSARESDHPLAIGSEFPNLALRTLSGETIRLDSFRGETLLINLWATWCAPCRRELPDLDRLAREVDARRLRIIGVAIDADDHLVRELLIQLRVGFPNYLGVSGIESLALKTYPQTILVASDGRILGLIEGSKEWDGEAMRQWLRERLGRACCGRLKPERDRTLI